MTMKGTTLRALGLNIGDVDERVLLDEGFDCSGYGLTKPGLKRFMSKVWQAKAEARRDELQTP